MPVPLFERAEPLQVLFDLLGFLFVHDGHSARLDQEAVLLLVAVALNHHVGQDVFGGLAHLVGVDALLEVQDDVTAAFEVDAVGRPDEDHGQDARHQHKAGEPQKLGLLADELEARV